MNEFISKIKKALASKLGGGNYSGTVTTRKSHISPFFALAIMIIVYLLGEKYLNLGDSPKSNLKTS